MGKYSKLQRCDLCGKRYAYLNSTWHITSGYRKHFCTECTIILEGIVRKAKLTIQFGKQHV
jgi:hypothetical protein